jgi:hypothetical protein
LASSEVLMQEPRVAVELLKEVEKDIAVSAREVEAFFKLAAEQAEGRARLDDWLKAYCEPATASQPGPPEQPAELAAAELAQEPEQQPPAPAPQPAGEADN